MTTPTMDKMLKVYKDAAEIERLKCGCPEKGTVKNTVAESQQRHQSRL